MKAVDLCREWAYRHLDSGEPWTEVVLPHDAMIREPRLPLAPSGSNTGWFVGRDYEYHRQLPREWSTNEDLSVVVEFDGVYQHSTVSVDDQEVVFHPYGYTNFLVDISQYLLPDRNQWLRVVTRNSQQPNSRWYSGAGIYREVKAWLGPREHIQVHGVKVRTLQLEPTRIEVVVDSNAAGQVEVNVHDPDGKIVASGTTQSDGRARLELDIPNAQLWGPNNPALYQLNAVFVGANSGSVDEASTDFGIRTIAWGERGFLLNGERVILQGACVHHDNGILGACAYPQAEERKVKLLKQTGYNAIRSAHNPCSTAMLEACDRLGMLVVDEYIDHWYIHKTHFDYVDYFEAWWREDLQDMVRRDFNHPSVVMYSTGNEVSETAQPRGIKLTGELTDYLHQLDPTRPVTCGINIFFNYLSSLGLGVYSDKKAAREVERADRAAQSGRAAKSSAVGSQFFNDMAGIVGADFMKFGATLRGCDRKTRDAFANMDLAGYNYGIRRYRRDLRRYPQRLILGTETFCCDAYEFRELAKREARLIGDFVWAGIDYIGEVGVGSWEYRADAPRFSGFGWLTAGSGRLDLTGRTLGEALYTRVALEASPGPYIAVRPVMYSGQKHSPSAWKMTDAVESWSWLGCEGRVAQVEVYARAASVDLVLNGRRIASQRLKGDCRARFRCRWEPGVLEAVTRDAQGCELGRRSLASASNHVELRANAESNSVSLGSLVFIRLAYTDEAGIVQPTKRGILRANVEGGMLLGFGSAAPFNPWGYCGNETGTYYGQALAVVRATSEKQVVFEAADARGLRTRISVPVT